jgi:3-oxoacyl-[acyl-carrier protein] reductase
MALVYIKDKRTGKHSIQYLLTRGAGCAQNPGMSSLQGKVALVTGASGGIGQATAVELARRGADVVVHYFRNKDGGLATERRVRDAGRRALLAGGDVTRPDDVKALAAAALAELGRVDILVNNAGDMLGRKPLLEIGLEQFRAVMDVNLTSTLLCTQALAPGMIERRSGTIVNMSSLAAQNGGGPGAGAYAAAKAAVMTLTKALARELAPHQIRVNCVSPGLIDETSFHARFTPRDAFEGIVKTIPLGRAAGPQEVATVIAFLAGDDSSFLTGETVEINGGALMR